MSKTILADVDGFTPVIDSVVQDTSPITALVFGRIWRFCQLSDGVCKASLETISKDIGLDRATIYRHADILVEKGYLEDKTPDLRNKPHTYADTGKAGLTIQLKPTVADNNTTVAQSNVTVAESRLKRVFKKHKESIAIPENHGIATSPKIIIPGVVGDFDIDENDSKPKKIKQPKKINHIKMLEPQTRGERILFGLLQAEITATRGQGWKVATRFPSKACKDMFDEAEGNLNGEMQNAIKSGLQKGILSIPNLVSWVHGWKPKGEKVNATNDDLRAAGYPV
jgi:hypothetical protein